MHTQECIDYMNKHVIYFKNVMNKIGIHVHTQDCNEYINTHVL